MFRESFIQAIHGKIWRFLVGSGGSMIAVFLVGKNAFNLPLTDSIKYAFYFLLFLFLLRYLYYLLKNVIVYVRKKYVDSIWGEAIVELKDLYANIHYLTRQGFSDKEFMEIMVLLCDTLKRIFDNVTKANCSVSISVAATENVPTESMEFMCLCRDSHHADSLDKKFSVKGAVIGNTPYYKIVSQLMKGSMFCGYINNDVQSSNEYDNTKKELYPNKVLPYKSELVYPIVPLKKGGKDIQLFGFIWIECERPNKFDKDRYDFPMVAGIADGIVDIFKKRENN